MAHAFFNEPFAHLHDLVIGFLTASPSTVHAALPLLRVNRHWRGLAIRTLVRKFSMTKLERLNFDKKTFLPKLTLTKGGEYLKSTLCFQERFHQQDDPRFSIVHGHPHAEMILLLSEFDPKTLICRFTPAQKEGDEEDLLKLLSYEMPVNKEGKEVSDIAITFSFVSTVWFKAATENSEAIYNLELAARPERFPFCSANSFYPRVVEPEELKKTQGRYEVHNEELPNGWTASWHTVRFEESPKLNSRVEVILALHEVKIPLIDLFAPRRTSAEKDYYEGDFVG